MGTSAVDSQNAGGDTALRRLKSTDAPLYLSASPELSEAARLASKYLYSSLKPYTPKSPFAQLLTDGFDAEQIWQQIDLQSEPLLASIRRQIKNFEKNPEEISKVFNLVSDSNKEKKELELDTESEDLEDFDKEDEVEDGEDEDEEDNENEDEDEDEEEDDDEEEEGGKGEKKAENGGVVEDRFFKINELEEYMEDDEAREYGLERKNKKKRTRGDSEEEDDDDQDEDGEEGDEEDEEEDAELGLMGLDGDDEEEDGGMENSRYEDFFGSKKGTGKKKTVKSSVVSDDMETDDEIDDDDNQKKQNKSTHEKELEKLQSTIKDMEKANMDVKAWTMQGEVTAAKRPKNSALEVDLDFEHNVRPPPVITEEVTASLEELIQKRIAEGRFDDVQKPPGLPSKAPRETKELDDNKSKKGLAEIYEEEYVQKTGLVSTALSFSDEQKKEASVLFKKLCLKFDALSHFHFTPKPVIEEMSVQANVPALAMEEIAPVATSDAAMLAPEEVFIGKGNFKEETEVTQEERKRRRAKKKRKFKAESAKKTVKVAPQNTVSDGAESHEK